MRDISKTRGPGSARRPRAFPRSPCAARCSTIVSNLLIVLAGLAAFRGVEIREMPDVDRPVITVRATYEGATPETIDRQVTDILEGAASRVPGVKSISSSSRSGSSRIVVEFDEFVDINVAANDLRDAVGNVERQLPDDVEDISIVKADDNSDAIMRLAVTAEHMSDPGSDAARRGHDRRPARRGRRRRRGDRFSATASRWCAC